MKNNKINFDKQNKLFTTGLLIFAIANLSFYIVLLILNL
ncbi:MAG: hypothetical protein ACJA1B_001415 [Polaribacter sp.]|jgi:hypothetical protein